MTAYAIRPVSAASGTGVTTAINATSGTNSAQIKVLGTEVIISVGAGAPIAIGFGPEGSAVTAANGLWIPANGMIRISVPGGATHLNHIRSASTDSTISVLFCDGGI